jgi:Tol biopolymer transport system component
VSINGKDERLILRGSLRTRLGSASWSPDDRRIAFADGNGPIGTISIEGGDPRTVVSESPVTG